MKNLDIVELLACIVVAIKKHSNQLSQILLGVSIISRLELACEHIGSSKAVVILVRGFKSGYVTSRHL